MTLSSQALNGTEGSKTIRLRGFISGHEAFMLVDSGSSHCFLNERLASKVTGWQPLPNQVRVRVANGAEISCAYELPELMWGIQVTLSEAHLRSYPWAVMMLFWEWIGCHIIVQ